MSAAADDHALGDEEAAGRVEVVARRAHRHRQRGPPTRISSGSSAATVSGRCVPTPSMRRSTRYLLVTRPMSAISRLNFICGHVTQVTLQSLHTVCN